MSDARTGIEKVDDDWRHPSDKCDRSDFPDAILAALAEAGLVIVPREATVRMRQAGENAPNTRLASHVWRAMVEAANE